MSKSDIHVPVLSSSQYMWHIMSISRSLAKNRCNVSLTVVTSMQLLPVIVTSPLPFNSICLGGVALPSTPIWDHQIS